MYEYQPIAIIGLGTIMPDAESVNNFWQNILESKVSIREVPASRWLTNLYYDPQHLAPDKTYSKIGGFVTQYSFEPLQWKIPIPPNVQKAMDIPQKWAIACTRQALLDYGYPERPLNTDRTAVIFGNALAGELHYATTLRIRLPEFVRALEETPAFQGLPDNVQQALKDQAIEQFRMHTLPVSEDTMPGELANVIAGRVANVFNLRGPNFVTDAACASSFAALQAAVEGLNAHRFDAAVTGGIDTGMGIEAYVKFSKIGAISADGSRPYDAGANGFVMGEGAAVFLLKRLEDAERDQDPIYTVLRGIGSSSDGAGKGITAPNPVGQVKAVTRAWESAGITPASAGLIEGHGTSTRVGDVVEVNSLHTVFEEHGLPVHSIALSSVKSNIGHLKSASGAAGMLKSVLALHHKTLPPSANFNTPNPGIAFERMPFYVNTQSQPWENQPGQIRRAGVSSFGFGGTNFHVVLEEYVPGLHEKPTRSTTVMAAAEASAPAAQPDQPTVNVLVDQAAVQAYILAQVSEKTGYPVEMLDLELDLEADLGIDTVKQAELFAAVREHFGIPRIEDLRLTDYNTLERVIQFVIDHAGSGSEITTTLQDGAETTEEPETIQEAAVITEEPVSDAARSAESVEAFILQLISEKTGYPTDMLDLQLDLEADLGVDTVKQAEMFLNIREHYGIERREDLRLSDYNTLEKVIQFVMDSSPASQQGEAFIEPLNDKVVEVKVEPKTEQFNQNNNTKQPLRNLLFIGADSQAELAERLAKAAASAEQDILPAREFPTREAVARPERIAIDFDDAADLVKKVNKTIQALNGDNPKIWFALAGQGIRYGQGQAGKVAFMFPGQGSQYVNMLRDLIDIVPVVRETYAEADAVMSPILGKPLTDFIFVEGDAEDQARGKEALKNTIITQPAVLTCNVALLRMLAEYGYQPDMVAGHSLGEYAGLVAAGVLPFEDALRVVSARGQEMSKTGNGDGGCMAAVTAPLADVQAIVDQIDGYAVIANINSPNQSVIGGTTPAIDEVVAAFTAAGYQAVKIQVSQAFHTKIVQPASEPLRQTISEMHISAPQLPIVANVHGGWYPSEREEILDILAAQVHSPVQFVKCVQTLYDAGGRVFVEVGPKRVLNVLVSEILADKDDIYVTATNHPRKGGLVSFNETIACLLAAGIPMGGKEEASAPVQVAVEESSQAVQPDMDTTPTHALTGSVVISGTGLGLPGKNKPVFAEDNVERLLNGEIFIEPIPDETRQEMLDKSVIRLVKSTAGAQMIELDQMEQTIKLAGQPGSFDLAEEFGLPPDRVNTYDISTQLAIAAGVDALREAGIPLVMSYKKTTVGSYIPDRWKLPQAMADETGVIFASAFPGLSRMAEELDSYHDHKNMQNELESLKVVFDQLDGEAGTARQLLADRMAALETAIKEKNYHLDRNFVFRILTMGHSQFAEYIGARGPNTHVNGACASTTQAVAIAEDWIRTGRCRRVIVVAGDDVASGNLMKWIGSALMASGAATIEGDLRLAALPFDRRRNGMIIGMGAAALVVEAQDAVAERGMSGICEVLSSEFANSAFHGTRLNVDHVSGVMDRLLATAEQRFGIQRAEIASKLVFVSHETYTPARGGSASAEIYSLRHTFGEHAKQVIIANTKGYTGHSMGVGVEDVLAVKALELGRVPPIANFDKSFQADPELGDLNLSAGGDYHPDYALRLGAGFGSQLAMTLYRRIPSVGARVDKNKYQQWLAGVSGYPEPDLEVEKRTLRIKDMGEPVAPPRESSWTFGQQPIGWSDKPDDLPASTPQMVDAEVSRIDVVLPDDPDGHLDSGQTPGAQRLMVEPMRDYCLDLISEKTGYPVEMLELDLDLETDLGIDTVKQAEVLAELREHYHLPRRDDLRLSDYNTIGKVISFLVDSNGMGDGQAEAETQMEEFELGEPDVEPADTNVSTQETRVAQPIEASAGDALSREAIMVFLRALVSEKTGYPEEMLDPELDLEADLGIDTVKQAELFAAVRERYDIPRREDLVLSDYSTLEKVIRFVEDSIPSQTEEPVSEPDLPAAEQALEDSKITVIRRVPVPVLRPKLSVCQATEVRLASGDRVLVVADDPEVGQSLSDRLAEMQIRIDWVDFHTDPGTYDQKTYKGIYFLNGMAPMGQMRDLSVDTLQAVLDQSLYRLLNLVKTLDLSSLAFMICGTSAGGLHGYSQTNEQLSMVGAIAGFSKSFAREYPDVLVKVVDFEPGSAHQGIAEKLIAETLRDPDVIEVGWRGDERYTIQALPMDRGAEEKMTIGPETVFLVSGGAGGILVPVVKDLAARSGGKFILFGRTKPPMDVNDPTLRQVLEDRLGLKQALIEQAREAQEKVNPAQIEQKLNTLERQANIQQAIQEIAQAGGEVSYHACDVQDQNQVSALIQNVIAQYGHVDVLIHAAGIEKSRLLKNKDVDEFRQVFEVKVMGFFHLYKALIETQQKPLQAVQVFSSVAGRYGNPGQADYAAANDMLCRWMEALQMQVPETQFQALDWSAWDEVGMAVRGFVPAAMEKAGIEMLPVGEAAPHVGDELIFGGPGEVVLAGKLGMLEEHLADSGNLDVEKANKHLHGYQQTHGLFDRVVSCSLADGVTLSGKLDPTQEGFLIDHAMRGIAVMPGVMGIEGFVTAAEFVVSELLSDGEAFHGCVLTDIVFGQPLKFYRDETREVLWHVQVIHDSGGLFADVRLQSVLKTKLGETRLLDHFSARVHLIRQDHCDTAGQRAAPEMNGSTGISSDDIYRLYFHGPSFQVLKNVQRQDKLMLGTCQLDFADGMDEMMQAVSQPLLIESCFQTAGIWEIGQAGQFSLPHSIGNLRLYPQRANGRPVYACVKPSHDKNGQLLFDAWVMDDQGQVFLEMDGYQTTPLLADLDEADIMPFRAVTGGDID